MMHSSRRARAAFVAVIMLVLAPLAVAAQQPDSAQLAALREGLPLQPERILRFTTSEGTWLSLDVSPDGRTIVFDMLGDLYTLPIEGGTASPLTQGMAFDAQPRFSPDGTRVLFLSDRSGGEGVWTISLDRQDTVQITKGKDASYLSPEWTPDGKYVVVTRAPTRGGSGTVGKLWLYHVDGGSGTQLIAEPANQRHAGAAFGSDPRYIWFEQRVQNWIYNSPLGDYQIAVFDRETGERAQQTFRYGAGMRPTLSPDGKWLVYATRHDADTGLRIRDLASGGERWLAYPVQHDEMESRASLDAYPGMSFTPDSRELVAYWGGKIWRVPIAGGAPIEVPFQVNVAVPMAARVDFDYPILDSASFTARQIENVEPSPDGRRIAFTALDRIYTMDLPNGTPRRLTDSNVNEFEPVWSPDGRWIAYSTWSETDLGHLYKVSARGGAPIRLTTQPALYQQPVWSPDGARVLALRGPARGFATTLNPGSPEDGSELVWVSADGGPVTMVSRTTGLGNPHFVRNSDRIYVSNGNRGLVSMRWDGTDVRAHVKVTGAQPPGSQNPLNSNVTLMSPTGLEAIAHVQHDIYLVTVPAVGGTTPTISVSNPDNASFPARKLTTVGGQSPAWSADGRSVHWSIGNSHFVYDLDRAQTFQDSIERIQRDTLAADSAARASARTARYEPVETRVHVRVPRDIPRGVAVLRGARVITMRGDEVLDNADILIRDNRIAAVGARGSVDVPGDARVIDVAGKTIVPGFVDTHAHMWPTFGTHRDQVWMYIANLAYGVTATRDPQTATTDVVTYGDRIEAGEILGPRVYGTGPGVFFNDQIKSFDDAKRVLRRYSDYYDTKTIKQYGAGNREVRQWVIKAAKELGLMSTTEGSLDMAMGYTEAMDGYSGHEHAYPVFPLYQDFERLIADSRIAYSPTLLVAYGAPFGENFFYATENPHDNTKLRYFTPHLELDQKALRLDGAHAQSAGWFHPSVQGFDDLAREADDIMQAGGRIGVGSHGQLQGLGYHWEMWALGSGGMSNHDVLRAATLMGADAIGLDRDIGSIEVGKLADLVVLDRDPLADLRNTDSVNMVMINGRLFDASTLNEVFPRTRPAPRFWWHADEPR